MAELATPRTTIDASALVACVNAFNALSLSADEATHERLRFGLSVILLGSRGLTAIARGGRPGVVQIGPSLELFRFASPHIEKPTPGADAAPLPVSALDAAESLALADAEAGRLVDDWCAPPFFDVRMPSLVIALGVLIARQANCDPARLEELIQSAVEGVRIAAEEHAAPEAPKVAG